VEDDVLVVPKSRDLLANHERVEGSCRIRFRNSFKFTFSACGEDTTAIIPFRASQHHSCDETVVNLLHKLGLELQPQNRTELHGWCLCQSHLSGDRILGSNNARELKSGFTSQSAKHLDMWFFDSRYHRSRKIIMITQKAMQRVSLIVALIWHDILVALASIVGKVCAVTKGS